MITVKISSDSSNGYSPDVNIVGNPDLDDCLTVMKRLEDAQRIIKALYEEAKNGD